MKRFDPNTHICGDCKTSPCPYHDGGEPIEGWTAELTQYPTDGSDYYRVFRCPHFVDGSECLTCADFKICKRRIPYGIACQAHARRARKSARKIATKMVEEMFESFTVEELAVVMAALEGACHCDFAKLADLRVEFTNRYSRRKRALQKQRGSVK